MLRNIKDKINCCGGSPTRSSHKRSNSGKIAPKKRPLFQKKGEKEQPEEKSIFDSDTKIWGEFNFDFKFKVEGQTHATEGLSKNIIQQRSLYQASILNVEAQEKGHSGFNVPIKCTWYRQGKKIPEISSNVYQLSAKDIGCIIRCEAEPLDPDFEGKAIGEYGPVKLDIYAKQFLEQTLGAGGNRFPIKLIMSEVGNNFETKEDSYDAELFINQHVLSISLKDDIRTSREKSQNMSNTTKFKYTMDYPKIELHPFDTSKLSILYNDLDEDEAEPSTIDRFAVNMLNSKSLTSQVMENGVTFERSLDIQALSRETRDLIALTMKCFVMQGYFVNASIENTEEDQGQCDQVYKNSKLPHLNTESFRKKAKVKASKYDSGLENKDHWKYPQVDVLLEMDFIKHDLNQQIRQVKEEETEVNDYKLQFYELEDKMAKTIQDHKDTIEKYQNGDMNEEGAIQDEQGQLQQQVSDLQQVTGELEKKAKVVDEEKANLQTRINQMETKNEQLQQNLEKVQLQMGVPQKQFNEAKQEQKSNQDQIFQIKQEIEKQLVDKKKQEIGLERAELDDQQSSGQLTEVSEMLAKKQEEFNVLDLKCRQLQAQKNKFEKIKQLNKTDEEKIKDQQNLTEEEKKKLSELHTLNDSLQGQTIGIKKAHEQLQKELKTLLKDKDKLQQRYHKEIKDVKGKTEEEKETFGKQITQLTNANERLEKQIAEVAVVVNRLSAEKTSIENKFNGVEPRDLEDKQDQVDTSMWTNNFSQQTIEIRYKESGCQTKESMKNEKKDKDADKPLPKSKLQIDLEKSNQKNEKLLVDKDDEVRNLQKKLKEMQKKLTINQAMQAEKDGTVTQLQDVVEQKEQTISDLQQHSQKLMERLANAEMKLFEMQDSFTESGSHSLAQSNASRAMSHMSGVKFGESILQAEKK